jgi:hypothetical protein
VTVEWHQYNREDKPNTTPANVDELVWIFETFYTGGVDVGYFDGFTFRMWSGSDDCNVTHWAPMETPEPPPDAPDIAGDDD